MNKPKYIPGDLVMYNDEINRIEETINTTYVELENYAVSIPIYDIKPVPLTPEILKKNGWEKENVGYSTKNQDPIFLYKDKGGGWAVEIGDEFISVISFVHQLQHLLFGLGLDSNMIV